MNAARDNSLAVFRSLEFCGSFMPYFSCIHIGGVELDSEGWTPISCSRVLIATSVVAEP